MTADIARFSIGNSGVQGSLHSQYSRNDNCHSNHFEDKKLPVMMTAKGEDFDTILKIIRHYD